MKLKYSLLNDPLFTVQTNSGLGKVTLPGLFALLETDGLEGLPRLASYQQHALYAFLAQVAAIVFAYPGDPEELGESGWKEELLVLTEGKEGPWCLVEEDDAKAAFMQPPTEAGKVTTVFTSPDGLDVLKKAKNHDVKLCLNQSDPELWLYALISLQTMRDYPGKGNYGVSRSRGGYNFRLCVSRVPTLRWGQRWHRDLRLMRQSRDTVVARYGYQDNSGVALVWMEFWDRKTSLGPTNLDPWYVEICCPVRLKETPQGLQAFRKLSTTNRVVIPPKTGVTGDPWTPIQDDKEEGPRSLTVTKTGFTTRLVHRLLFEEGCQASLSMQSDEDCSWLLMSALTRDSKTSTGYHERIVPVPPDANQWLRDLSKKDLLRKRSADRLQKADQVLKQALPWTLCILLHPELDPKEDKFPKESRIDRWKVLFSKDVDLVFIEELWKSLPEDVVESTKKWWEKLETIAEGVLNQAINQMPISSQHRYKAIAKATNYFKDSMKNLQKGVK